MADEILNPLLALIKEQALIDDLQFEEVVAEHKRAGTPVIQILQDFGIMDLDTILQIEANHLGVPVIALKDVSFSQELLKNIPANTARMYQCIPIAQFDNALQVAFVDPLNPARVDEVGFTVRKKNQPVIADPAEIEKLIERHYGQDDSDSVSEILKQLGEDGQMAKEAEEAAESADAAALADLADAAPIVRFVNLVVMQAVQDRASDIHFEPFETEFRIRYRVDGALYEMSPPPKHLAIAVVSRIKVMSNLIISERRVPQDGRIAYNLENKQVDLRVSTLPTQFGESVVLRVLDRTAVNLEIESLGLPKFIYVFVNEVIQRPNGIF